MDEKQVEEMGKKLTKVGKILTFLITLPFIGFIFFGITGLIIGSVIGAFLSLGVR